MNQDSCYCPPVPPKTIKRWQITGAVFSSIVGSLLHFTYAWSGDNPIVGLFSAVNESTWEHMKLLFFPMLVFFVVEMFFYGRHMDDLPFVRALSMLIGLMTIPVLFYTYTGIIGRHYAFIDISIFIIAAALAYASSYRMLRRGCFACKTTWPFGVAIMVALCAMFFVFTFSPPSIGLFAIP